MADDESAYSSFGDFEIPDKVKNALTFRAVNPGPLKLVKVKQPSTPTKYPNILYGTKSGKEAKRLQTPSEILKGASMVNIISRREMSRRYSASRKHHGGSEDALNLEASEVVFNEPNFNGSKSGLCGIFRGIGTDGKKIAQWAVNRFKKLLKQKIKLIDRKKIDISQALTQCFLELHQAIGTEEKEEKKKRSGWMSMGRNEENEEKESMFNYSDSGITATIVWLFQTKIVCANVGDSTCIVGSEYISRNDLENGVMKPQILAHYLTEKHDIVNNEDEISRIKSIGEAEFREQGVTYGIGTEQLCFPGQNIPGLMLTRLLGYHMAEPLGVIPKPSIYEMEYNQNAEGSLNEDGEYQNVQTLVIATPGLWDTVGPFEAIQETLSKCRDGIQQNPAEFLASKAYMRYSAKDVSCIVLKFGWGDKVEHE